MSTALFRWAYGNLRPGHAWSAAVNDLASRRTSSPMPTGGVAGHVGDRYPYWRVSRVGMCLDLRAISIRGRPMCRADSISVRRCVARIQRQQADMMRQLFGAHTNCPRGGDPMCHLGLRWCHVRPSFLASIFKYAINTCGLFFAFAGGQGKRCRRMRFQGAETKYSPLSDQSLAP